MRWLLVTSFSILISGCIDSDPATDLLETYTSRTSNAIDYEIDLNIRPVTEIYSRLPPRRERIRDITESSKGLLGLLELRHCDLVQLVSERNTSLGRVAPGSQRLIYELKLLPKLDSCITKLRNDPEQEKLLEELIALAKIKHQNLPNQIWNSIYTAPEMEQHFSLGENPLPPASSSQLAELKEAMRPFIEISKLSSSRNWLTPTNIDLLEASFETLYRSQFGAQWISSMSALTQTLNQTSEAIEKRLQGRPICFNQKQNTQSKILWNVFIKFYVESLQPYIAQIERDGREWSRINLEIIQNLNVETEWISNHLQKKGPIWGPYIDARNRHTEAWQAILDQCGLRPGV